MSWSDERVAFITTQFLDAGQSAGQIALQLGVTREAVCGKLYRLGIRRPAERRVRKLAAPRKLAERQLPRPAPGRQKSPSFRHLLTVPELAGISTEIALLAAGEQHCRWIEGKMGGAWYVCGKPKAPAGAFCACHAARAYRRPKPASGKTK